MAHALRLVLAEVRDDLRRGALQERPVAARPRPRAGPDDLHGRAEGEADRVGVPPGRPRVGAELLRLRRVLGRLEPGRRPEPDRMPAVAELGRAAQGLVGVPADPDRNAALLAWPRQRVDLRQGVVPTLEARRRLAPARTHALQGLVRDLDALREGR